MGEVVAKFLSAWVKKIFSKELAALAKIFGLKLAVLAGKLAAFLAPITSLLHEGALYVLESPSKKASDIAARLFLKSLSEDPKIQAAAHEMYDALFRTLLTDYLLAGVVLILSFAFPLLFVSIALTYKALSRPKLDVFISFNRTKEAISEILQKNFEIAGAAVFRIPSQETIPHQDVNELATKGIKRCDSFVCLPGHAQSYVEGEVMAATASEKPVVFVVSEANGTLPNTANKRHPVFRLETAVGEQFKSLIEFLDYVGADFKSTRKLCLQALRHPHMQAAKGIALGAGALCLLSLWAYCYCRANMALPNLTNGAPELAMVERPVRLAHFFLLAVAASAACVSFLYCFLFGSTLVRQFRARSRVRLKTIAAQFNRDDWIGVIPGLSPGTSMYECLFAAAPLAHHEIERKLDIAVA